MPETAAQAPHQQHRELDQRPGHPGSVHDLAGQDEQGHRHQREHIELRKNLLGQDRQVRGVTGQHVGRDADRAQHVGNAGAGHQQHGRESDQDERGHAGRSSTNGQR